MNNFIKGYTQGFICIMMMGILSRTHTDFINTPIHYEDDDYEDDDYEDDDSDDDSDDDDSDEDDSEDDSEDTEWW